MIEWRCGVCNAASPVGTGGICARCKKFACNRHLNIVLTDKNKMSVCSGCTTADDQVAKALQRLFRFNRLRDLFKKG